jgi:hypothetical protein
MSLSIEHLVGEMSKYGVQRCTRCGEVIVNYRGCSAPAGSAPLTGFQAGAAVFVTENCQSTVPITDDVVPCQGPYHEHTCRACGEAWLHGYGGCERRGEPSDCCPSCRPEGFV